jgi:tetratricopeptide (TPR) repeat protein
LAADLIAGERPEAAKVSNETARAVEAAYATIAAHYHAGENVRALAALEDLAATVRSFNRARYYYFKISILGFRYRDFQGVVELCEQATGECPRSAPLWFLRGRALSECGRGREAISALIRALRLDPEHKPAILELTKLLRLGGRGRMAAKLADRARALQVAGPQIETSLAAAPARPAGAARWRLPRNVQETCRGVILFVGTSYCGSTLVNSVLGAHPDIAGAGEMHWLVHEPPAERAREGRCVFCGDSCKLWTPELRADLDAANLYDLTAGAYGKAFVCDTSKMPDWSEFMAAHTAAPRTRVLLVKHPIRIVASNLANAQATGDPAKADMDGVLRGYSDLCARAMHNPPDLVLRYEDFVASPSAALTPILNAFGLAWDDAMADWRSHPHHYIGGNVGPRSQIAPRILPMGDFLQRKYRRPGIFLDDSFRQVLTPEEIARVVAHPRAREICDRFGYDYRIAAG